MKKHILFLFAAALALVGCSNEDLVGEQPAVGQQVTLKASVEVGGVTSRVAADDLTQTNVTFHWETGDKVILVNPNNPTEQQELSIVESSINGTSACFTGNALSNMKYYMVYYGKGLTSTAVTNMLGANPKLSLTNATNNQNYLFTNKKSDGTNIGNGDGFTLYPSTHIRMQLKGDGITLGKVEYYTKNPADDGYTLITTIACGTNGLALSATATDFILPANMVSSKGFKLVFYDNEATPDVIMEKTSNFNLTEKVGKMVNFGELEVKEIHVKMNIKITSTDIATVKKIKVVTEDANKGTRKEKVLDVPAAQQTPSADGTVYSIEIPSKEYAFYQIYLSDNGTTYKEAMAPKSNVGELSEDKDIDYEKNAVQLWADGPYFATQYAGKMSWTEGMNAWGSAWTIVSESDLNELTNNYRDSNNFNTQEGSTWGWKFTGKAEDYTGNSIFLPSVGSKNDSTADYWISTEFGPDMAKYEHLYGYMYTSMSGVTSYWCDVSHNATSRTSELFVYLVLK